jgi:3-phenylpropionate/trans-cinnamate dioxygenase ferredoxin reductase subunit
VIDSGLVVVGSGPAGLAAVRAFRRRDADRAVTMITADPHPPYARPPLTKDFAQGATDLDELWLTEPGWFDAHRVELRLDTAVEGLDTGRHLLRLSDGTSLTYTDVVLATGSRPTPLPVPGGDDPDLIYVRDLASGHRLRGLAETGGGRVAVIGSGFIGCEAAASLALMGLQVVLVSAEPLPQGDRLGPEAGREIRSWLSDAGVELLLGTPLASIRSRGDGFELELADGVELQVSEVVAAGGAHPAVELAEHAGLSVERGGVRVDASLRASAAHVFAAGDIAFAEHPAAGRHLRVEHWGDAEQHGTVAGTVAAGGEARWEDPPGFWSSIGERTLKYAAWGDGHDEAELSGGPDSWRVWYRRGSEICGVLTHNDDEAYERGQRLLTHRS